MSEYRVDIRSLLGVQAASFKLYIQSVLPSDKERELIDVLSKQCTVFIFGGIIRDFVLGFPFHRDIDIVVKATQPLVLPKSLLKGLSITKNKFGGVKLQKDGLTVDVWDIGNTWGLLKKGGCYNTPRNLTETVFFNFSAIVFDYNDSRFIYNEHFVNFYKNRAMEVVFPQNPFPSACIVNAFYYSQEFGFKIGQSLRKWIVRHADYTEIERQQIRRYGEVLYPEELIQSFVGLCRQVRRGHSFAVLYAPSKKKYIVEFE